MTVSVTKGPTSILRFFDTSALGTLREHMITFEVVDTGKGISKEWQARLMRPYAQEHEGAAGAPSGGTGLGLALVKILCEKMDGTLKLTSAGVGLGTTTLVQVQLDSCVPAPETPNPLIPRWTETTEMGTLSEENSAPTSPTLVTNSPPRRLSTKMNTLPNINVSASITCGSILAETKEEDKGEPLQYRVLVVDDLTLNRRLLAHMISSFFSVVDQAGNGKEAFDMAMAAEIKGIPYDAIVTDQEMPIMTGVESLHRMASCNVQSKFVMVCGNPDSVNEQLLPHDDITVLVKPIRKEDFSSMVFPSVVRRRRRRELRRLQADVVLDGSYYGDNSRKSARVGEGSSRTLEHGSSGTLSGRQPSPKRKSLPFNKRESIFGPELLVPQKRESFAAPSDPLLLAPALSRASSSPKLKHAGSLKRDSLDPRKDSIDSTNKRDSLDPPRPEVSKRGSLDPTSLMRKDSLDPDTFHITPELLVLTPSRRAAAAATAERKPESAETDGLLPQITVHIN